MRRKLRNRMAVIGVLLLNERSLTGYQIGELSGVWPGALYPILAEMEEQGIVRSAWEVVPETGEAPRPARRLYWWCSVR